MVYLIIGTDGIFFWWLSDGISFFWWYMGVSENSVPLHPIVLLIIIPMKNGYFIGKINPIFRQTQMSWQSLGETKEPHDFSIIIFGIFQIDYCYTLWLFNSSPWKDPPIFKNGKPSISMGHLSHGELLVITRPGNLFQSGILPLRLG